MIVLDTNVISEMMRSEPNPAVFAWVAAQPRTTLFTTSITQIEVVYGIAALPVGRRRDALTLAADAIFSEDLAGRILPLESSAAVHYAEIVLARRFAGKPIEAFDALIAATARAAKAAIATRDIGGFEGCGLELINPWEALAA
jgi:predicted nucleic acid-binding protein